MYIVSLSTVTFSTKILKRYYQIKINPIKFHGHPKSEEQILKLIFWEVRIRMSGSSKFKKTWENIRICQIWNLACYVLY
jgi:hypothetical protein